MTPVLPNFDVAPVPGDIVLCLCNEDRQWLNVLAKLGSHRGVTYTGELVNESAVKGVFNVIVNYSATSKLKLIVLFYLIAIMKFIGSITGLVSFSKSTALQLAGVDFWLLTADKLVSNQVSIEDICRLLSNNLSSSDFLGAQYVPNITDVVMFSLVDGQTNVSNNVELWLKRMRKLLN
uniref:Crinkler (CRN) family protein n=1 Tax=Syphacia muris TaxID=451379 RepID=A0A0N5AU28_9BILA